MSHTSRVACPLCAQIAADLFGVSSLEYGEPVACGTIRFLDTANDIKKSLI